MICLDILDRIENDRGFVDFATLAERVNRLHGRMRRIAPESRRTREVRILAAAIGRLWKATDARLAGIIVEATKHEAQFEELRAKLESL